MPNAGHLVLGVEGLALLRRWLVAEEAEGGRRVAAMAKLSSAPEQGLLALRFEAPELGVTEGYARWSESYDAGANPLILIEEPVVQAMLERLPVGDALDAACGTGRHASFLAARGHRIIGVDASREMLDKARASIPSADFRVGSLEALPLEDASVDLVVCGLALTHVMDLDASIAELARVLRPGGRIVLSDLHPMMVLLGGSGLFFDAKGAAGNVRTYHHAHASYLEAFRRARLDVVDCVEPVVERAHLPAVAGMLFSAAEEAFEQAYLGLPFALVWMLERSARS